MATQKDVAKLAKVSFITVSRVVNGENNVRPETRERVLAAIEELGYQPSFAGKALNTGRNDTIGLLVPVGFDRDPECPILFRAFCGIESVCRSRGMDVLISTIDLDDDGDSLDATSRALVPYKQKKADGMIYLGMKPLPESMAREIERNKIRCVVLGDRPAWEWLSWVDSDDYAAGYQSARRMLERGHRKVAYLGYAESRQRRSHAERERGFRECLAEARSSREEEGLILRTGDNRFDVRSALKGLVQANPAERPTALFCANDGLVYAAMHALRDAGIPVPEEIALVGFGGYLDEYCVTPAIATNRSPITDLGRRAAEILLAAIDGKSEARTTEVLPVDFVDGRSFGAPAPRVQ